ncbi:hypothetical protein Q8A73_004175 [Channa argus]|nr:hypothetical protein Q8A73_004175 [Channa argus]
METPALRNQEVLVHGSDWMLASRCRERRWDSCMNFLRTVSLITLTTVVSPPYARTNTRDDRGVEFLRLIEFLAERGEKRRDNIERSPSSSSPSPHHPLFLYLASLLQLRECSPILLAHPRCLLSLAPVLGGIINRANRALFTGGAVEEGKAAVSGSRRTATAAPPPLTLLHLSSALSNLFSFSFIPSWTPQVNAARLCRASPLNPVCLLGKNQGGVCYRRRMMISKELVSIQGGEDPSCSILAARPSLIRTEMYDSRVSRYTPPFLLPPSSFKKVTGVKVQSLPVSSEIQRCTLSWTREARVPPPRCHPLPGPPRRGGPARAAAQPGHT